MNARLGVAAAVAAAALAGARPAHAVLSQTCHLGGDPAVPWFAPKTTVDVWVTTDAMLNPMTATGVAQVQFENAVRQSLEVWNEESGASIKLRYRGTTTAVSVSKAVVITGRTDICNGGIAWAFPHLVNNKYEDGTIEFEAKAGSNCAPVLWTTSPTGGGSDVVAVLNQELGHQVYNIGHPTAPSGECIDFGQLSVMKPGGGRVLGNWDLEVAQARYTPRAQYARFFRSKMTSATTWQVAFEATGMSFLRPLFRAGSMTQNAPTPWFGWIFAFDNGVQAGGTGRADVNRYQHGTQDWNLMTGPDSALGRPVAMASKSATELLLVYQRVPAGSTVYNTRNGQICWRRSVNSGVSWSTETCPANALATTYGLTAAFDKVTNNFIIAFTQNSGAHVFEMAVLTVPAANNTLTPSALTFLGVKSSHGPGIACGGSPSTSNCVLPFHQTDTSGLLAWMKLTIAPASGLVTHGAVSSSTLLIYDTPSVIYVPGDNTFRLAYTVGNSASYSYKMNAITGTSWTGTGDIFNNSAAHVSTVVLTGRLQANGVDVSPYAWFIKYW